MSGQPQPRDLGLGVSPLESLKTMIRAEDEAQRDLQARGPRGRHAGLPPFDYSLMMGGAKPPIAGPGSEMLCPLTGPSWCGYCGFTGRVVGPRQASCPERHGWHGWLAMNADHESLSVKHGGTA